VEGELADPRIGLGRRDCGACGRRWPIGAVLVDVDGDDEEAERSLEGLLAAKEYIRHELVERFAAEARARIIFPADRSEREKARVEELLARAKKRMMKPRARSGQKKA